MGRRSRRFELRVLPLGERRYGLELYEALESRGRDDGERFRLVARVWGTPMQAVLNRILAAVKKAGSRATDLRPTRKAPFRLDEETGVRLGLMFLAVKPLRKSVRIAAVSDSVVAMSNEETYYWFSKCSLGPDRRRAQRSLRILLSKE